MHHVPVAPCGTSMWCNHCNYSTLETVGRPVGDARVGGPCGRPVGMVCSVKVIAINSDH